MQSISIIIPCKNEESTIGGLVNSLLDLSIFKEIIIVDDGSTDHTQEILKLKSIKYIKQPYSKGNGAAIKAGARAATGDILVCMDADGQHKVDDIQKLITGINDGYDMVVGARDSKSQASTARLVGNKIYNRLASLITGHEIKDLTSGFRAVKRKYFMEYLSHHRLEYDFLLSDKHQTIQFDG